MNDENKAIDAIFVVAQHDKCSWASSIMRASGLCRALYNEETAWCAFSKAPGPKLRTPLMYQAKVNNTERLKFLIKRGPSTNLNIKDNRGRTACHWAAATNAVDALRLLVSAGIDTESEMDNGSRPLHVAVNNGRLESTKFFIDLKVDINAETYFGSSALSFACDDNYFDIALLLLQNGADPDNTSMSRPLHIASTQNADIVKLLLEHGADPNARSLCGLTALHRAAEHGPLESVKVLCAHGADPNAVSRGRLTPILHAKEYPIIAELLKAGADPNAADIDGHVAIFECVSLTPCAKTLQILIKYGANVEAQTATGLRPLYAAAQNGYMWAVETLLKAGAHPSPKIPHKPICISAYFGYIDVVKMLLSHGASVNDKNQDLDEPLYLAAGNGHTEIVKLLLKNNADPNYMSRRSALDSAAEHGYADIVQILIDAGANVNLGSSNGRTPIYVAAKHNRVSVINVLHKNGAKLDGIIDVEPVLWSPLFVACVHGHYDAAFTLMTLGAKVNDSFFVPLLAAINNRHICLVRLLLQSGANPNLCVPLLSVVREGYKAGVQELLKYKVNLDVQDNYGRTPLLLAIGHNFTVIACLLLDAGADPNIRDNDLIGCLYVASKMKQHNVVKKILALGGDPNIRNSSGFTALHISADLGHTKIVKELLKMKADKTLSPWASTITALDLAKSAGHRSIVKLLEETNVL